MKFEAFPKANDQHNSEYNKLAKELFTGDAQLVHVKCEDPDGWAKIQAKIAARNQPKEDALASTSSDDPHLYVEKINMKEIDRLHCHIRAIDNDCHIVPQGSMKMNQKHEV